MANSKSTSKTINRMYVPVRQLDEHEEYMIEEQTNQFVHLAPLATVTRCRRAAMRWFLHTHFKEKAHHYDIVDGTIYRWHYMVKRGKKK